MSWTRFAQAYPKGVAEQLAAAHVQACGFYVRKKLQRGCCAKSGEGRYGNFLYTFTDIWYDQALHGPSLGYDSRWERMEPPSHRLPLPEALFRAMMTVSLGFGWVRFAAVLGLAFYGITRPSEPLLAARRNLILPRDRLEPSSTIAYLKIVKSKTSGRGNARIQHATIEHAEFVNFLQAVFSDSSGSERVYACSSSAFRRRWDAVLRCLDIPASAGLTRGGVRGGGCVAAFQSGCDMTKLLWKMRLKHLVTLENYLQEVSASTLIPSLPGRARSKIQASSSLYYTAKFCHTRCD